MAAFSIIYADPPWDYKGGKQHTKEADSGCAAKHYKTVTTDALKTLNVSSIAAPDCLLFLWVTGPHLDQGIDLMQAWGFEYKQIAFAWNKMVVNPGNYTMTQIELCLVGKRGRIPQPRGARNARQLVEAKRTEHSVKPEEVRRRIDAMFPGHAKVELFARTKSPGWSVWGDEVESDVTLQFGQPPTK